LSACVAARRANRPPLAAGATSVAFLALATAEGPALPVRFLCAAAARRGFAGELPVRVADLRLRVAV
jgi:hypothetical protein